MLLPSQPSPSDDLPATAPAAPRRPSLVSDGPALGAPDRPLSVLAALDGAPPPSPATAAHRARPWLAGLGGLALALWGAVWMGQRPAADATTAAPLAVAQAPKVGTASAPLTAPLEAPAASASLAAVEDLPATTTSAFASTAVTPSPPAQRPVRVADATSPEPAAASAAIAARPAREPATARAQRQRKDGPLQAAKSSARAKDRRSVAVAKSGTVAPAGAGASAATRTGDDADVDLIAALVQHMNRESGAARDQDLTIADLVARCKALPAGEAQRCQRRICDHYWGRAEACPRSQAPSAVVARP